ncbi:MAG: ASPIC/UnbV domain-containing protein, partial [Bryobacteraceae bacterium]
NRDGIGAKAKLISESGKVQYGMVTTTASYQSAQDKRLFFGIGREKAIRRIEIAWPSGTKQIIENPQIRKILTVTEK